MMADEVKPPVTCLLHGGYHPQCDDCAVSYGKSIRLFPGDFILVMTNVYPTRREEYRFGQVRTVNRYGGADGYTDADGMSRIVGSARYTWAIPARWLRSPERFWVDVRARGSDPFLTFSDAHRFAHPYSKWGTETATAGFVRRRKVR